LRFAVRGPGNPVASPRSHGVPRRDVPSRVHVGVDRQTADAAPEPRLALSRLRVAVPAARASLRRVRGVDLLYPPGCFPLQPTHQQAPTRPHDLPVEPSFGPDVPARIPDGPLGRARHVLYLKVLDTNYIEPPRDVCTGFFHPVLAPVRRAGVQPGDCVLYSPAAARASLCSGKPALQAEKPLSFPRGQDRNPQQLSGRQSRADGDSSVDPHYIAGPWCRKGRWNGGEGDMPAPGRIHSHPIGLDRCRQGAGPAEPYPSGLRDPDFTSFPAQAAHVPLPPAAPDDPESLVTPGLAPGRPPRGVARVEERRHCLGEVPQCLLLYHLGACGEPCVLCADPGELTTLLQVARRALPSGPPPGLLLDREVPYKPSMRAVVSKHYFLDARRDQAVTGHSNTIWVRTDILEEVKRRVLASKPVYTPRPG
jgi:hypothetical protein